MPKSTQLTIDEKARIESFHFDGRNNSDIGRIIGRSESAVRRYLSGQSYGVESKRNGRKRVLDDRDLRHIWHEASNKCVTARRIKSTLDLNCSLTTIRMAINESPYLVRKKMRKIPPLTSKHKETRVAWATAKLEWTDEWKHWVFSDEKKFNLDGPDGYNYYWHDIRKEELCMMSRQNGGGSVMVWGAIGWGGRSDIMLLDEKVNSVYYQRVLESGLVPVLRFIANSPVTFQQDNASPHVSKSTIDWLNFQNISTDRWPAKSPDLNPIENCWGHMAREVYKDGKQYDTVEDLRFAVKEVWNRMPQHYIQTLISSMEHRVKKVIEHKGEHIGY